MTERFKRFPPWHAQVQIPTSSRNAALAGLALYPACRGSALWAQGLARSAIRVLGPGVLPGRHVSLSVPMPGEVWDGLLSRWAQEVGDFQTLAVYRRRQSWRSGFAVLLIHDGVSRAFVKLRDGDASDLRNEAFAQGAAWRYRPETFIVPEPLAYGQAAGWNYLASAPLPVTVPGYPRRPPLGQIVAEIEAALAALPRPAEIPTHWRPMHGDFTPWNLRWAAPRTLYLYDWEEAGWGPPGADEVLFRATHAVLRGGSDPGPCEAIEAIDFWLRRVESRSPSIGGGWRLKTSLQAVLTRLKAQTPDSAKRGERVQYAHPAASEAPRRRVLDPLRQRPDVLLGVLDAGFASLATLLIGLFAARILDPATLGAYGLCFRALFLAGVVPSQWRFVPAENLVTSYPASERLRYLGRTVRLGLVPAAGSALAVILWILAAPPVVPTDAAVALSLTAVASAFVSPIQDHVRRMLHIGRMSHGAALVSMVQLLAIALALLGASVLEVPPWWIPFGSLAFANLASLAFGIGYAHARTSGLAPVETLRGSAMRRSGRWLLLLGLLDPGAAFLAATTVAWLGGVAALGYAEAARIVAQPVIVLAWGLSSVLGPRSVEAARNRRADQAQAISRVFVGIMVVAGGLAVALFSTAWWGNPLAWLVPKAYFFSGLVTLSILAHLLNGMVFPYRSELLGGAQETRLARVEVKANAVRMLVAGLAGQLHAYAAPLSVLGFGVVRWLGCRGLLRGMYLAERPGARVGSGPSAID